MTVKPAKSTAAVAQPDNLQGLSVDAADQACLREAIELAVHYRGDVTVVRSSTNQSIEGYIFDHKSSIPAAGVGAVIRMIPKDADGRIAIPVSDIASLSFTGKDTASGKTFENWIKKYVQKKTAGETASIESESLDE